MRILIVNTFYYPNMQGGAEQSVKLLAEGLARRGHEVGVYCVDSRDGNNEEFTLNGVSVFRRSTKDFNLYRFSYDKKSVSKLEKIQQKLICYYNPKVVDEFRIFCKSYKPDVIHTNTTYGMSGFVWKCANSLGIPVIHTVRDIAIVSPVQHGHKSNAFIREVHRIITNYTTRFLDGVASPSEYTLRTSLETGAFKNARIKACVFNSVQVDYDETRQCIEERRQRTDSKIKFMYAGRLIDFKGIVQMIEAFEKIKEQNCELHICGGGEMVDFVKERTQKNPRIIYCGKLNNEDLAAKYKECDVLLFPSVWPEPFGRVAIEGNMYGMPVIAGDCGGIPEIFQQLHGGVLCDCSNIEELYNAMVKMTDRSSYEIYYENIMKKLYIFDIEKQIDDYLQIYRKIQN